MNGMHVIYVPPSVLKNSPAMWLQMVTKHRGKKTGINLFLSSKFLLKKYMELILETLGIYVWPLDCFGLLS